MSETVKGKNCVYTDPNVQVSGEFPSLEIVIKRETLTFCQDVGRNLVGVY